MEKAEPNDIEELWENTVTAIAQTARRNTGITPEQEQRSKGSVDAMRDSLEKDFCEEWDLQAQGIHRGRRQCPTA